jgi:hypothetical protein
MKGPRTKRDSADRNVSAWGSPPGYGETLKQAEGSGSQRWGAGVALLGTGRCRAPVCTLPVNGFDLALASGSHRSGPLWVPIPASGNCFLHYTPPV